MSRTWTRAAFQGAKAAGGEALEALDILGWPEINRMASWRGALVLLPHLNCLVRLQMPASARMHVRVYGVLCVCVCVRAHTCEGVYLRADDARICNYRSCNCRS